MSGVRAGSRLERLETLARRLDHEIAQERRLLAVDDRHDPLPAPVTAPQGAQERPGGLPDLPDRIDTATIRQWAATEGHANPGSRGRLSRDVIDAFYAAHQPADGPS